MTGATFIDLTGAFQIRMGDRDVMTIAPGAAFQFRQRVNLATNPSFEATSGTVTVRTNLMTHPRPASGSGWGVQTGTGGVAATTYDTSPMTGRERIVATWSTAPTSGNPALVSGTVNRVPLTAGSPVSASLVGSGTPGLIAQIRIDYYATGNAWLTTTNGQTLTLTDSDQTFTISGIAPANAVECMIYLSFTSASQPLPVGAVLRGGDVLVEASPVVGPYFDGSMQTDPDPDLTPAWTGPVNASTSVLRGVGVAGTSSDAGGVLRFSSTQWAASGSRSLRWLYDGKNTGSSWIGVTITAGRTYRLSLLTRVEQPVTVGVASVVQASSPYTTWGYLFPNNTTLSGEQLWSLTFTPTAGTSIRIYRPGPGSTPSGISVWYDELIIEDITDAAPAEAGFFSGDTPDSPEALHHWTGPANASTSAATQAWGS